MICDIFLRFKDSVTLRWSLLALMLLMLTACAESRVQSAFPRPAEINMVPCEILKADGTSEKGEVSVEICFSVASWNAKITPDWRGVYMLPVVQISENKNEKHAKDFVMFLKGDGGYLITRNPADVHENAKLKLNEGGNLKILWLGQGVKPFSFSIENSLLLEYTRGSGVSPFADLTMPSVSIKAEYMQEPPGAVIISATIYPYAFDDERKEAIFYYIKWGELKAGETTTIELGKTIESYEIKCLLPESLPSDLKIKLSLQNKHGKSPRIVSSFVFAERVLGKQEVASRIASGFEEWYFENWPIKDNCFSFIADKNWAKLNIMMTRGKESFILLPVEFMPGESHTKIVDLRNNELLLKSISK